MTVRVVEGKKPYTGGTAIEITEDKVINLLLREANNLLQVNGNNELFCDLQLNDELRPTDDFPVGVTTGRIVEDNGWDWEGTILCAKTTSGDNIKLVYTDEGEIWVDNGTGTFKKMYLASEVDTIIENLTTFKPFLEDFVTDGTTQQFMTSVLNSDVKVGDVFLGQVSLSDMPSGISVEAEVEVYVYPSNGVTNILYCIMRSADVSPYLWECNSYQYRGWQPIGGGGGGTTYTAGTNIQISSSNVISATDTTYTASDFDIKDLTDSTSLRTTWSNKQDALVSGINIKTVNNQSLLGIGNVSETVMSGDANTIYTIKVSSSAPASGTPNTTITFKTAS